MTARPRLRRFWQPVVVGVVVGFGAWVLGVVVADAILLAALMMLVLAVPRWAGVPDTFGWPNPPEPATAAGWYEVRRLASVLQRPDDRPDAFAMRVAPHLRTIATGKLARLGVDWHDPAARRLLGPDVYALLNDPGSAGPDRNRSPIELVERVLGRLDEIPDTPSA